MSILGTTSGHRRSPGRVLLWRTPSHLAMLFALIMALGSLISSAAGVVAAPQPGNADLSSQLQVTGTSSLEVDVVRCPEGFDPNDLFGACHDNGEVGIDVRIVSVDPALGVDQTQTTNLPADPGPGRTSFADLAAGDYNVSVDLAPESGVRYYVYCGIAGGGDALPATPDNALNTVVTVPEGQAVACDVYIIPTEAAPEPAGESTIELFAFTCAIDALPDDGGRDFADFQAACADIAAGVDFTLVTSDDNETLETTDQDGQADFTYPAGSPITFYSGVPLGSDEVLFCSIDQGQPEDITIDSQGVSTFDNAAAEDRICSWFLVEADEATAVPTEGATEVATEVVTEEPDQESSLDLVAYLCPSDAIADPGAAGFGEFQQACGNVAPDLDFQLNTGELQGAETTDANGQVSFIFPVGEEVNLFAAVPLGSDEHLFCSVDGGDAATIALDDQGVAQFPNTEASPLTCSWYLIEVAPGTEVLVAQPTVGPTEELSEAAVAPGEISFFPSVCPQGYDPNTQGAEYEALSANCAQGVENVSFTFEHVGGDTEIRVSDGQNPIAFPELEPGTYTLFSDVPLEAAREFVFCVADGGNRYQKELNDRGVTTFGELETEQIACEWYIVPTDLRGEETGGSLEIHLAVCPGNYTGNTIFDDCHGNGLEDYEYTLEGPGGADTGTTEILQDPGPGVVTFTSLAAGEYTFYGGPPGDFGSIRLFCSTQPGNETPDFAIEGGMASLTLGENEHVLCDWYFIPEDAVGPDPTPTPTPEPARAEILVTLYACPPTDSGTYGGSSLGTYREACTETVNDVSFRLGDASSAPLSAETGVSGEGAVRFFELLPGDLTMSPSLPSNLTSAAVFCTIDGGSPYQKALSNGGTTFVNVDGESIACSWFAVEDRIEQATVPSGSITIREYLCEDDASEIVDWDAECAPGSTGASYTIGNTASGESADGAPGDNGVFVFGGLPNGFYTLEQNTGNWCRAVADRVDSESRVIVEGGGNTDVVLYQCNAVEGLPDTGSGPGGTITSDGNFLTGPRMLSIALGLLVVPLVWAGWIRLRQRQPEHFAPDESTSSPTITVDGRIQMRFR